jgi:hypothetical protein
MKQYWNRFCGINQEDGETEEDLGEKWNEYVNYE